MELKQVAEYQNFELYHKLLLLEPPWYIGKTTVSINDHYKKVHNLLEEHGIKFDFDIMHMCRDKPKIELWKTKYKQVYSGRKTQTIRDDEYISIYEKGGSKQISVNIDPEKEFRKIK